MKKSLSSYRKENTYAKIKLISYLKILDFGKISKLKGVDMFGANDNTQTSNDDPAMLDNVKQLANEPADQVVPAQPQYMTTSPAQQPDPSFTLPTTPQTPVDDTASTDDSNPSAIAEPAQGFSSSPMPDPAQSSNPVVEEGSTSTDNESVSDSVSDNAPIAAATLPPADPEHLAGMKQQALDHLEPLVGHLEQSPEESFKTTMMMIQANDNHTLLEKALQEAKLIEDDKARANAMLDIINEINYFSQVNQS